MGRQSSGQKAGTDYRGKQDTVDLSDPTVLEEERTKYVDHVILKLVCGWEVFLASLIESAKCISLIIKKECLGTARLYVF